MDTSSLNKKLLEEKEKLEREMETVGRKNPAVPNDYEAVPTETGSEPDIGDEATLLENQAENSALLNDLESRYDDVLAALNRLTNGTYGLCLVCGEKIEDARLQADPAAKTCVAHKEQSV